MLTISSSYGRATTEPTFALLDAATTDAAKTTLDRILLYIERTVSVDRDDRLWPADSFAFSTHPLSLAYGASGIALLLQNTTGCVPPDVIAWMGQRTANAQNCPPSLYVGLAGLGCVWLAIGEVERSTAVMNEIDRSELQFQDPSMFYGCAGWGFASLIAFARTGSEVHLSRALRAGHYLESTAVFENDTASWPNTGLAKGYIGFGFGPAGIALFLAHLWQATGEKRFGELSRAAIAFTCSHLDLDDWRVSTLTTTDPAGTRSPTWLHGASGVGSALIRLAQIHSEPAYRELAVRLADRMPLILPGISLFEGITGAAEFLLDVYSTTSAQRHAIKFRALLESINSFAIERHGGTTYAGAQQLRVSADFGTGSAGVGMLLHRALTGNGRAFHDLCP